MHAFDPGGLHDHPPSTSSVMVVMQSLGKAEHQQGQPGAGTGSSRAAGACAAGTGNGFERAGRCRSAAGSRAAEGPLAGGLAGWALWGLCDGHGALEAGSVSRPSVAPGPRSLAGLEWLVRVGATPLEPWGLVMGWGRAARYDHVRRLAAAGLVRTVPMTRGDGSLGRAHRRGRGAGWIPRKPGRAIAGSEHVGSRKRVRVGQRLATAARALLVERPGDCS